ncbi:AAA family ATPase [Zavarzinia sp. CC-PAN008]|uniref:AAA family ATPase n=1 Tax=Zavarzinia sp. CC-PAN008 TaxID=3243332 RepID=UPI003F74A7AA
MIGPPSMIVVCGGIAAGKTRFRQRLALACPMVRGAQVVSTDVMAAAMAGVAPAAEPWGAEGAALLQAAASAAGEALMHRVLAAAPPLVVWETTLAWDAEGAEALAWLARIRAANYRIILHGLTCDPAEAEARAAARGGRPLRTDRIAQSHALFRALAPAYVQAVDRARLWDTTGGRLRRVRPLGGSDRP